MAHIQRTDLNPSNLMTHIQMTDRNPSNLELMEELTDGELLAINGGRGLKPIPLGRDRDQG